MIDFVVRIAINAAALWAAIRLVPQLRLEVGDEWWRLVAVAAIFAVVNATIRPVLRALAFPLTLLTLGLATFVINAALFLLVAAIANQVGIEFRVGGFPPALDERAIVGALLGSIVVSVVSTLLSLIDLGRRSVLR